MKNRTKTTSDSGQMWRLMLLLAAAVILPTVCLLWFMTQAVENVQLAARQKVIDLYEGKLDTSKRELNRLWDVNIKLIQDRSNEEPIQTFRSFATNPPHHGQHVLITYDELGELLYPIANSETEETNLPEEFESAWELEFVESNFEEALKRYEKIADSAQDDYIWRKAKLGQARCHVGLGKTEFAMARPSHEASYDRLTGKMSAESAALAARARIMHAKLNIDLGSPQISKLLSGVTNYHGGDGHNFLPLDSATRIFSMRKALKIAQSHPKAEQYKTRIERTQQLLAAEEMAAEVIERYPNAEAFSNWPSVGLHRLEIDSDIYGLCVKKDKKTFLLLRPGDDVRCQLSIFEKAFAGDDVSYQILDDNGQVVSGTGSAESEAFLTAAISENMPGWKIKLYFADSDVFSKFASRQVTIYVWAGVLVIVLILAAGGFAVQTVGRQMKLNRLKNDFIATVTHELKTPLASMRVLVDTLLEGNYKEQKQATEYLELIARENERLSNLIDNFLTFSRMERNKQAFEMLETSPALIAKRAAEAVKTKFEQGHCTFDVAVDENLPDVLADQDAMVTALINLLDNSYKYSYDDKQIKLSVYAEVGSVCFRVADNGIGMSRKAIRKIFERFYQADQTLSRRTQGCGLGLSIVKFIVDAHNGSINLESKPNKGSVFTIKLPAVEHP